MWNAVDSQAIVLFEFEHTFDDGRALTFGDSWLVECCGILRRLCHSNSSTFRARIKVLLTEPEDKLYSPVPGYASFVGVHFLLLFIFNFLTKQMFFSNKIH